ncbi:hypothetical protein [Hymenobacter defluvii]|uniref:Glycerophosphoryl diester phosphodiesterase membrane domain-containing protein n=1 Tax=Hymenobacter defluvii TaxID=2054411 RepID=A0ABS3TFM3_9BACT|nr:hypothetical protein [Hymenobacter defluvii]MBO3272462.1 hypothetical protein [Hymenobacter defluvii]
MRNTFTHELDYRQERDFGQKINATFAFLQAQGRPLGRVLLYIVLPVALLSGIGMGIGQAGIFSMLGQGSRSMTAGPFGSVSNGLAFAIGVAGALLTYLLLTATLYEYVRLRMALPAEEEVTPALVWPHVRTSAWWILLSGIVLAVLTSVGFVFLFFPGVYLAVALSPFFAVMIMERNGFSKNFSRCFELVSGYWWATFGLLFVMWIIQSFVGLVFQIPTYLLMGLKIASIPIPGEGILTIATRTFATIGQVLLYAPTMLALLFQYFNLIEIKDGVGMRHLVDSIGQQPTTPVSSAAYRPDEEGEY